MTGTLALGVVYDSDSSNSQVAYGDANAHVYAIASYIESVFLFSKLINLFFGCFDPVNIFIDIKNKQFSG